MSYDPELQQVTEEILALTEAERDAYERRYLDEEADRPPSLCAHGPLGNQPRHHHQLAIADTPGWGDACAICAAPRRAGGPR